MIEKELKKFVEIGDNIMEKITKKNIIRQLADKECITYYDSEEIVNSFLELIIDNVVNGNEVNLSGFGKFTPKHFNKRRVIHPKTGEETFIRPYDTMLFSVSKSKTMKARFNGE